MDSQLLGGVPSGFGSAQTYHSARGLSRFRLLSTNQGWRSELWGEHQIDDHAQAARMGPGDEMIEIDKPAEERIDITIIGDIVAEIRHRRDEERGDPDRVRAQIDDMIEMFRDAAQIAHAVAAGIGEGARIDLIDGPHGATRRDQAGRTGFVS